MQMRTDGEDVPQWKSVAAGDEVSFG